MMMGGQCTVFSLMMKCKTLFVICMMLCFMFVGCQSDRETRSVSLKELGISLQALYEDTAYKVFPVPKFAGLFHKDTYTDSMNPNKEATLGYGTYTELYSYVEIRFYDENTVGAPPGEIGVLPCLLFDLRAYPIDDIEDNCIVRLNGKTYRIKELEPFQLCQIENHIVYDFKEFDKEIPFSEYAQDKLSADLMANTEDNPEYLEYDYVKLQVDVRNWLIEQIKQDYPIK